MPKMSKTGKQFSELSKQQEKSIESFSTSVDGLNESVSKLTDIMISNNVQKKLAEKTNKKSPKTISKGATKDKKTTTSPFSEAAAESFGQGNILAGLIGSVLSIPEMLNERSKLKSKLAQKKIDQIEAQKVRELRKSSTKVEKTKPADRVKLKTASDAAKVDEKVDEKYDLVDTLDKLEGTKNVVADVPQLIETNKKIDKIYKFLIEQPPASAAAGDGIMDSLGPTVLKRMAPYLGRMGTAILTGLSIPVLAATAAAVAITGTAYFATKQNAADVKKASDEKDITDRGILDSNMTEAEKLVALTKNAERLTREQNKMASGGEAMITYDPDSPARIARETLQADYDEKARKQHGDISNVKTEQVEQWIKSDEAKMAASSLKKDWKERIAFNKAELSRREKLPVAPPPTPPTPVPPATQAIVEAPPVDILQPPAVLTSTTAVPQYQIKPILAPPPVSPALPLPAVPSSPTAVPQYQIKPILAPPPVSPALPLPAIPSSSTAVPQAPVVVPPQPKPIIIAKPTPVPAKPATATPPVNTNVPVRVPAASQEFPGLNFSKLSPVAKENAELISRSLKDKGYNTGQIAAVLGKIRTEVGPDFVPKSELSYENTSADGIKNTFAITKRDGTKNAIAKMSNTEIDILKKDPEKFYNTVYGKDSLKVLGNTEEGDGYKYRGRGYIQITGRDNYAKISKKLYGDEKTLLDKPELLNNPEVSAKAMVAYLENVLPRLEKVSNLSFEKGTPKEKAQLIASAIAAGGGQKLYSAEGGVTNYKADGSVVNRYEEGNRAVAKLIQKTEDSAAEFLKPDNNRGAEIYAASSRVDDAKGSVLGAVMNFFNSSMQENNTQIGAPKGRPTIPSMQDSSATKSNNSARS